MSQHFSFFKPAYGWIKSFDSKYQQGDTVFVKTGGQLKRGRISGWILDRDMNFLEWQVTVPSLGHYVHIKDPKCPWNK